MILDNPDKDLLAQEGISDDEMIAIIAEKVQAYLDTNINLLMSYLYRLDVKEVDIKVALMNLTDEPGNLALAKLIWKRQKQRMETKRNIKTDRYFGEEWEW